MIPSRRTQIGWSQLITIAASFARIFKLLPKTSLPQTHRLGATDGDGALAAVSILGEQYP
jgi:hypothetical protein